MKEKRDSLLRACALLLVLEASSFAQTPEDFRQLAKEFTEHQLAVGIMGTLYQDGEFHDFTTGQRDLETGEPVDEHTLFELGSATKTFTGTLLAREVVLGNMTLDQTVASFFPELEGTPAGAITLVELATHTSGLPRMPSNLVDDDGDLKPYQDYSLEHLLEYLKTAQIREKKYHYSNTGAALLSQILIKKNGMTYDEMVREFVQKPLGLEGLELVWSEDVERRMSKKYSSILELEPYWTDLNAMNGTGIIKIDLATMKKFMLAQMYPERLEWPLNEAIPLSQKVHAEAEEFKIGLGWFEDTINGIPYVNHNGSTEGFTVEFMFDVAAKRGFIYASNTDLMGPGLCMLSLFSAGECKRPSYGPIPDEATYIGTYKAGEGEDAFEFQILKDPAHQFLYLDMDGEIPQRLFPSTDGTLEIDHGVIVLKFEDANSGQLLDNWGEPATYPFVRVPTQ